METDVIRKIDPWRGTDEKKEGRFLIVPGFMDVHVHFRDPGMPQAETRLTGSTAAAEGGFKYVVTMPNTTPAGDNVPYLREQIEDKALPVKILPSACITKGRLGKEVADLEALAEAGAAFFTDDGAYVADAHVMEEAMRRAAKLGKAICEHAVDPLLLAGGVVRASPIARAYNLPVMKSEAEVEAVRRDIALVRVTGCALHIQHISCAGTVALIREARAEGLPVTGEATPHHLLLTCEDIPADDANWKMAPPLGNREDRAALREGVLDGTLSIFATDHAPHPADTKNKGFRTSANGIIGLETAIAATWQAMVVEEGMAVIEWVKRWTVGSYALVGLKPSENPLENPTCIDLKQSWQVDPSTFFSRSRNTPFTGFTFPVKPRRIYER